MNILLQIFVIVLNTTYTTINVIIHYHSSDLKIEIIAADFFILHYYSRPNGTFFPVRVGIGQGKCLEGELSYCLIQ